MKLRDIWEQVPADYFSSGYNTNYWQHLWHSGKLRAITQILNHRQAPVIADIGSADGSFVHHLTKNSIRAKKVIAIDPYLPPLKYGQKSFPSQTYIQGDAHDLPLASGSIDLAIILETIEHVVDPYCTLRELRRVIKLNGRILVEIDSGSTLFQVVWTMWKKFGKGRVWNHAHLTFFNVHLLEQLFYNADLIVEQKVAFNAGMGICFLLKKPS